MIYGSVCSGIEAASVAWHPLGWRASFLSEIEAFPRSVLTHHYPDTPLHGDFTTIQAGQYEPIDLLVGGTPCQSFSVAGLRGGLDDERGNLALEYLRLADRLRPKWLVWENVPGVLSSNGGRDFGSILGGMVELGYGFAYRVLDAQYFGVAQRRRRVFVVGCLGDWRLAAAVLFERESLSGNLAPQRKKGDAVPDSSDICTENGGIGTVAETLLSTDYKGPGHNRDHNFIPVRAHALTRRFAVMDPSIDTLIATPTAVRRLTPCECERLQGFPDNYTEIPHRGKVAADGPRYKALGNSMAVPVMAHIGRQIQLAKAA
jgi:DNA (cytosine-5)-methyltransferase 1